MTMNLSRGGCFVVTTGPWQVGQMLWLTIRELGDDLPRLRAQVRWCQEWGRSMVVPGIGLRFEDLDPEQVRRLQDLL
ncbi:MAG: PilZ domain-containing protein [Thermodesulfobacteriota bacterium]